MPKRVALIILTVAAIAVGAVLVNMWADWMVEQDQRDFAEICEALDAEPVFTSDYLCVRDKEVVYGED